MSRVSFVVSYLVAAGLLGAGGFAVSHVRAGDHDIDTARVVASGGKPGSLLGTAGSAGRDDGRYRLSALSVFSNVALHVKDHYVDPDRVHPTDMLLAALEQVEREIAEVLVEQPEPGKISVGVMGKTMVIDNDVDNLWEINLELREVFRFLEKNLPPQEDLRQIEYAAINGALSTLDPHSVLLEPQAFAEMKTSTKGEFGGLGIVISVRDGKLTIISPIEDTPAARAGLKAGDVIGRIGDVSTVSMPVDEAVQMLRGPKGSKAVIWVERDGWPEPRRFEIVRERIKLESVESELLSSNIGYIRIKNFQQSTGKDLEEHLAELKKKAEGKLRGLVLDLRNNPGGLLEQATRVSDKFVASGDIVTTVGYGDRLREPKRARWSGTETSLPLAVLVNRGSASASEIVAGALKNLDRATIIGETTFGKGSVQVLYDFADNSALKLTIAQYLTPGDVSIQNEGVRPDLQLRPAFVTEDGIRMYYRNDDHREAALEKHLERGGRRVEQDPPAFSLQYLVDPPDRSESTDEPPAVEDDPQVQIARDYLTSAGTPTRKKSLARGRRFVARRGRKEATSIARRLEELGVDWRRGRVEPSGLSADLTAVDAPRRASSAVVKAGAEVILEGSVTNRGSRPMHRIHGILASDNPAFEGRELVFGRIEPGETKTWRVKSRIPSDAATRVDTVRLELYGDGERLDAGAELRVRTEARPRPRFGFNWVLDDRERGDGDGILEDGEGVDFRVLVSNVGEGTAREVGLRIKSAAGEDLFLERGRVNVGELEPGATGEGRLRFRVAKSTEGRALPLELSVYDPETNAWLEARFDLRSAPPDEATAAKVSGRRTTTRATTLLRAADGAAAVVGTVPAGAVLSVEQRVGDFTRVALPAGDATAFVRVDALARGPRTAPKGPPEVRFVPAIHGPRIVLADHPGGRLLSGDQLRLEGRVEGRTVRDMYVLVNDDKVYFDRLASAPKEPLEGPEIEGWRAPKETAAVLPFSVNLPLEPGLNEVIVVGRLDETIVTHETVYVARVGGPEVATAPDEGAEAIEDRADPR